MPATSLPLLAALYPKLALWSRAVVAPAKPPKPAPCARCAAAARVKARKRRPASLPPDVREVLDDRIFEAIEAGVIDPLDDGEDLADEVAVTWGELNRLRRILLREDFVPLNPAARPTNHPPGSNGKAAEMERRAEAGEDLYHRHDAPPLTDRQGFEVYGQGTGDRMVIEKCGVVDDAPANRGEGVGSTFGKLREPAVHRELRE